MTSAQLDRFVHERLPAPAQMPELHFDRAELHFPEQINWVEELLDKASVKGYGDRPLLRSDSLTLSYDQARQQVDRIAHVLVQDLGLKPGNRVLLRGGNSVMMALSMLAVMKAGLVAVATMPLLRAKELGDIIDKAQPVAALCDTVLLHELNLAQAMHPVLAAVIGFGAADGAHAAQSLEARCAASAGVFPACATAGTDIALLAFTSGTTGKPKAAVHTHRDVLAACETWPRHVLRATPDDVVMGSPPLAFTFGLGGMLVFPMWAGASVYFPSIAYTPEAMARLMFDAGTTICYTAPTFYRQMAPHLKTLVDQRGRPPLRICVSAGEALPDAPETGTAEDPEALGDIALAYDTCRREAEAQGKTFADHVTHLIVHSTLHLLGYDHLSDEDAALMEKTEVAVLAHLGIADPYADDADVPEGAVGMG